VPRGFNSEQVLNTGFFGELIGSTTALGSRSSFLRMRLQDNRWFTLAPKWRLQLRGQLGATAVKDIAEVPAEYRFFAGGDNSVRGFGLYELSPTDADGLKTGGKYLIVGSVEIERALPRNFAVAAFVDAGNALNSFGDPLEYSAGIGLRFKLPFISVGFDVAQPLSEPGAKPRIHINIAPVF
jgi:translocation and assembly module TamA